MTMLRRLTAAAACVAATACSDGQGRDAQTQEQGRPEQAGLTNPLITAGHLAGAEVVGLTGDLVCFVLQSLGNTLGAVVIMQDLVVATLEDANTFSRASVQGRGLVVSVRAVGGCTGWVGKVSKAQQRNINEKHLLMHCKLMRLA